MNKKLAYGLYCIVIFVIIGLLIVIINQGKEEDKYIYATSIQLNCPREVKIPVDCTLSLADGFIKVLPSNQLTTYTITNRLGKEVESVHSDGNNFSFSELGYYYIKFSVQGKTKALTDTLVVNVVDRSKADVSIIQIGSKINVDMLTDLNDIFEMNLPYNSKILIESNQNNIESLTSSSQIKGVKTGTSNIILTVQYEYMNFLFNFDFSVVELLYPKYYIDISNVFEPVVTRVFNTNTVFKIVYSIESDIDVEINQNIICYIEDETIAEIINTDAPFISIQCKNKGKTKLIIKSIVYEDVFYEIEIEFY